MDGVFLPISKSQKRKIRKAGYSLVLPCLILLLAVSCSKDDDQANDTNSGCGGGPSTVADIDGNVYNLISIGSQCWMKENLRVSKYRNGDSIPNHRDDSTLQENTQGSFSPYENFSPHSAVYGNLYNGYAVADPRGLCPAGWHVPTEADWTALVKTLDPNAYTSDDSTTQSQVAGGFMKSTGTYQAGTGLWFDPNTGATNSSGFTALPGGYRFYGNNFYALGISGFWWTSTPDSVDRAWFRTIFNEEANVYRSIANKKAAFSVRCVRD